MIFHGFPPKYDYKMDIFSLGFTMYSFMNPTNNEDEVNLPKITEKAKKGIIRRDFYKENRFYSPWLIKFVSLLYHNDQFERPSASYALEIFQKLQINPNYNYGFQSYNNQGNINNINVLFSRQDSSNIINNVNKFNTSVPSPMSNSAIQNNNFHNTNQPLNNLQRTNSLNFQNLNRIGALFLTNEMGRENRVLSSMKSLLQVLLRLDEKHYIQALTQSLFSDTNKDYSIYFIHSYYQMLNSILPKDLIPNQINQIIYKQDVNEVIRKVFIKNNSGISGTRPIILFYMINSIIKDEIFQYFNCKNNILDYIIQNNFMILNNIIPITDQTIYNSISQRIFEFKNEYKGPLVDNFYFFILSVSRCSRCNNLFGIRTIVTPFLQLDVKNPQNNILDLINNYFAVQNGMKYCENCGLQVQKKKKLYVLNSPKYLILEFEDKNFVNFNSNIMLPLFNGTMCQYEYISAIYKLKINNITDFVAVFKYKNNLYFYSDDKIAPCPQDYINSQCPSLAIFKNICK